MRKNMGKADRIARILVAVIIVALYLTEQITGIAAVILLAVAGVFVATSFLRVCPLYIPFGFSTDKKQKI